MKCDKVDTMNSLTGANFMIFDPRLFDQLLSEYKDELFCFLELIFKLQKNGTHLVKENISKPEIDNENKKILFILDGVKNINTKFISSFKYNGCNCKFKKINNLLKIEVNKI